MAHRISYLPADDAPTPVESKRRSNRVELGLKQDVRSGWAAIAVGVLLPGIAIWGAIRGWQLREIGHPHGLPMLVVALTVFFGRIALALAAS
ncbi:MAG: hypothetical protein JHC95_05510 [Solirubrobacteraceae bacterium]|nr:hypothetical protein [Solirubrobacteraceae bacterium]